MVNRCLLLTVALAAAFNPNAPRSVGYPNQRLAHDPILDELKTVAIDFWRKRGVALPADVPLDVADDLRIRDDEPYSVFGRGMNQQKDGASRVVLQGRNAGILLRRARGLHRSVAERRLAVQYLGELLTHELGHVGGLDHTVGGVMDEHIRPADVPWDVKILARKLVPRPPRIRGLKPR